MWRLIAMRLSPSARAAGARIRNDADAMAACRLSAREIDDMAEQPADRSAQDVEDIQGSFSPGHEAFCLSMILSENRDPLFGIML